MTSTPIAKMVREMISKGVDPEVIELAVATAEMASAPVMSGGIPVDISAEKRRAYDRDRKRKLRGIPPDSAECPRNSEITSPSKEEIEEKIPERGKRAQPVRGQRLPEDWAPDADDWQAALTAIGADRARAELAKFRDHWKQQPGAKGVKLDWSATWRNWIRRAAEYHGGTNGQRNHAAARGSASADFFAGMRSVAADIPGHDPAPGPAASEVPLGRVNIDG